MDKRDFEQLLAACQELATLFPQGLVFIGGIAVYLHAVNCRAAAAYAEFTHDADLYLSLADLADLRDIEELTPNRRLSKHQLVKRGFEFDVYTERHSALLVPYDAVAAHAATFGEFRVACLAHLLVLKLEAYRDRAGSAKGSKDAQDLIRIALVAHEGGGFDGALAAPYLGDAHIELLKRVECGPEFAAMAQGNAVIAKRLRRYFAALAVDQAGRHSARR